MERSPKNFLAFLGQDIEQEEIILEIGEGYECWKLRKFGFDDFIEALKKKIPPVNDNVLRHCKQEDGKQDMFDITIKQFQQCAWGLLIPESLDDAIGSSYSETIFLVNLYSPTFLYPIFYASDFGIMCPQLDKPVLTFAHYQNQSPIFRTNRFASFAKMMLPQSQYSSWMLYRAQKWQNPAGAAYKLIERVYARFGHTTDKIPYVSNKAIDVEAIRKV